MSSVMPPIMTKDNSKSGSENFAARMPRETNIPRRNALSANETVDAHSKNG